MSPVPCAICGTPLALPYPCQQSHHEHCHDCYEQSLAGSLEARTHRAPPAPLVLSQRDVAALVAYQQHVQRTVGTGPLLDLVTQEDPPC